MGASKVGTLVIQLDSTGHRPQFTKEPPQVILHAAQQKDIVLLVCLGHDLVRDVECLGIVTLTPAGETLKRATVQLKKALLEVTGNRRPLLRPLDGGRKMPLPVGKRAEK